MRLIALVIMLGATAPHLSAQAAPGGYDPAPDPNRCLALGRLTLDVLLDSASLRSGEVEMARLTIPPGWDAEGTGHRHGRTEVLYVLSGRLEHVVNDVPHVLGPDQVGVVRPGDRVRHHVVSDEAVTVLAIWAPGGELARIAGNARPRGCD